MAAAKRDEPAVEAGVPVGVDQKLEIAALDAVARGQVVRPELRPIEGPGELEREPVRWLRALADTGATILSIERVADTGRVDIAVVVATEHHEARHQPTIAGQRTVDGATQEPVRMAADLAFELGLEFLAGLLLDIADRASDGATPEGGALESMGDFGPLEVEEVGVETDRRTGRIQHHLVDVDSDGRRACPVCVDVRDAADRDPSSIAVAAFGNA